MAIYAHDVKEVWFYFRFGTSNVHFQTIESPKDCIEFSQ